MDRDKSPGFIACLTLAILLLTACGAPADIPSTPTSTPTLVVDLGPPPQPTAGVELAAGTDSASAPYHVIEVSLASGETITLEEPWAVIVLHKQYYDLELDLGLIDSAVRQASGYLVTFNNGESLPVDSLEGNIEYEGDFGQVTLALETVSELHTRKNVYGQKVSQYFARDYYNNTVELTFVDGSKQRIYVTDSELWFQARYEGFPARLYITRSPMDYDWQKRVVQADHPELGHLELPIVMADADDRRDLNTDHGRLRFNWPGLVSSAPIGESAPAFDPLYTASLKDGTRLPVNLIFHACPPDSYTYECLKLDGKDMDKLDWSQVQSIAPGADPGSGKVTFVGGSEKVLEVYGLWVGWALGELELPFSASVFDEISQSAPAAVSTNEPFSLLIRLANGEEMVADVQAVYGVVETTAPGPTDDVLHLTEFPLSMGSWLVDRNWLEMDNAGGELSVLVFGQPYPAGNAGDLSLGVVSTYGNLTLTTDEIASTRRHSSSSPAAETVNVRMIARDGETYAFPVEKIQFVRYPDQIFEGTRYQVKLGAWYWRRYDTLAVKTASSTTEVDLNRIRRLTLSGEYPSWEIEIEGTNTGETMRGNIVPAEVAAQGPGIASWQAGREGFWFSWHDGHAFLFVPAHNIAEIRVEP